jgi:predicted metal-dependent HD superfamily phosphohydrolase
MNRVNGNFESDGPVVLDSIRSKYQEPHRHYHDWNHALSVLSWVNHCCDVYSYGPEVKYELGVAALFHDVVYEIGHGPAVNEEASVGFLKRVVPIRATYESLAEKIILATAQHGKLESEDVDLETALFMDCDIASFGEARWEIAPEQIKVGRKAFLGGLLAKRSIFLTPYFQDRFEAQARRNIQRVITEL